MSSILKALKKLEDDKATRRPDELKIDAEILRSDGSPRFSSAGVLLASLLLLAGGSGATYMYMKRDKAPEFANLTPPALSRQNQPLVSETSNIKTEQLPAAIVVVPADHEQAKPLKLQQPQKFTRTAPGVAPPKPAYPVVESKPAGETTISKSSPPTLSASVKTVPALRVNGIAFQDGGIDSVAMINGEPTISGSVINGVKIEEIYKNKVRFSYSGEKFEIQLGQSNR